MSIEIGTSFTEECRCGAHIRIENFTSEMASQVSRWYRTHYAHQRGGFTIQEVSNVNARRANRWHSGFPNHEDGWTGADWSNAANGEGGEMLEAVQALLLASGVSSHLGLVGNVVKKLRRVETSVQQAEQGQEQDEVYTAILKQNLATEIGDVFMYLDLLAQFYGLSMEKCVVNTFNRVSEREGFPERING